MTVILETKIVDGEAYIRLADALKLLSDSDAEQEQEEEKELLFTSLDSSAMLSAAADYIDDAFNWMATKEGFDFWNDTHQKLSELANLAKQIGR